MQNKSYNCVFAIFNSKMECENAVDKLKSTGFRYSDISVLMPTDESSKNFAHTKSTKAPEGVATGATSGAVIGGTLGWLAGIGSLAIPGIGPLVAAGPIVAAIAGAGIGGTVGGIAGALVGMGIPEYEAKRYEGYVKDGGILISVHVDDKEWEMRAKDILEEWGARDVATANEEHGDDLDDTDTDDFESPSTRVGQREGGLKNIY